MTNIFHHEWKISSSATTEKGFYFVAIAPVWCEEELIIEMIEEATAFKGPFEITRSANATPRPTIHLSLVEALLPKPDATIFGDLDVDDVLSIPTTADLIAKIERLVECSCTGTHEDQGSPCEYHPAIPRVIELIEASIGSNLDLDDLVAGFETLVDHYRGCIEVQGIVKARDFLRQLRRFIDSGDPKDDSIFTARGNHLITGIFSK